MKGKPPYLRGMLAVGLLLLAAAGCRTVLSVATFRPLAFSIAHITDAQLAGVDLTRFRSYTSITDADIRHITGALAERELPLSFTLYLRAENPAENDVQARLTRMDWTLLLEERRTVSGVFDEEVVLPPGQVRHVPIAIELDLVEFFEGSARDLIELALAVTGQGGAPKRIKLEATPTIETPLGALPTGTPHVILPRQAGP